MANWLTISDFIDDVQLTASTIAAVNTSFDNCLTKYQNEFLRTILGVKMCNELIAGLAENPILEKWSNLKDGCDFTYTDNSQYHLQGLKEALKYYSYVKYQKATATTATVQSNVIKKSDIAIIAEPTLKVVDAINQCIEILEELEFYINWKNTDYPNFIFSNPFSNRANHFGI